MKNSTRLLALIALLLGLSVAPAGFAQTLLTEDFTGTTSSNTGGVGNWLFFNGACLTAGTSTSLVPPASSIPACTAVLNSYYVNAADHDQYLVGGANGFLGGASAPSSPSTQVADPSGSGALRFTNGSPYGNQERGAIVSTNAYATNSGIQVTFKTVTYGGTGADGISFYLMDGCVPVAGAIMPSNCTTNPIYPVGSPNVPAIGATGGSLAFTCSNTNGPGSGAGVTYDGLTGGYLGLGIDEYGNFLNQGDNTGSGWGFQPGRIGLRGAGAISWPALNNAYGTNPGDSTKPFYPAYLSATCSTGSFDSATGTCGVCPAVASINTTAGGFHTTASTTTVYGSGICTNTTTTIVTPIADSGCTNTAYTYYNPGPGGGPTCAKCPSAATYRLVTDGSYPNGLCSTTPTRTTPSIQCSSGYSYDSGLMYCAKAPTFSTSFTTANSGPPVTTVTTSTNPPSSTPAFTPNVSAIQSAIQKTCSSGHLWNYATSTPTDAGPATLANSYNTAAILDYAAIPGAYTVLPTNNPLYIGGAGTRAAATPIFYNLQITTDGYLSLSYAYNGGAYQSVIAHRSITASNGTLPNYVRFGFAGSTGGATNNHEIMCFKSAPLVQSGSSAGINQKQSAPVEPNDTFAYFAYYDQTNWVGRVTANALSADASTGLVSLNTTPTWDASCVLSGVPLGQSCSTGVPGLTAAMDPATRVILTYNGSAGAAFEWGSLTSDQQAALTTGDASTTQFRFNYLRGDRTDEITSAGTCPDQASTPCFRARTSVLADIVDSSPTWVGPPQLSYTAIWGDKLFPAASMPENAGTQNYTQFIAAEQTRPNVVYVGSNDGMMHGFRSGAYDSSNNFSTASTPNDGKEVLAYMPGSLLLSPSTGGACASLASTGSIAQNIHGVTPAFTPPTGTAQPACVTAALDFSNTQYGHNFFVDATPGTGDLYYNGGWHTWLVGGLGAGGAALFALDVTNPTAANFAEGNAASLVIGEWTSSSITCVSNTGCGSSLGNTYGTPIVRRLHDGRWGVIFGNGYGSTNGDAGIFVMTVDTTGNKLFYYLSTGNNGGGAKNNGIAYVTSADLDGDHITDYVYAGDLLGNVWRFDLTAALESSWGVSTGPLFSTPSGQPITTQVILAIGPTPAGGNTLLVSFGTGQRTQFTNAAPVAYQSGTQSLYGVWDWNMSSWNGKSTTQYASLNAPPATGIAAPYTLKQANLLQQTFVLNADNVTRDVSSSTPICWAGSSCTTSSQFGWYLNLVGAQEQIVFNPELLQGVFLVNSSIPANNQALGCSTNLDTGFTYALSIASGTAVPNFFIGYHDAAAAGVQFNAVGTDSIVTGPTGTLFGIFQEVGGLPPGFVPPPFKPPSNGSARRLTWVQLR
jgi:type IV pilus assembly protein PilY1